MVEEPIIRYLLFIGLALFLKIAYIKIEKVIMSINWPMICY